MAKNVVWLRCRPLWRVKLNLREAFRPTEVGDALAKFLLQHVRLLSLGERGVNGPSMAGLERFAKALEVDVREFFAFHRPRK